MDGLEGVREGLGGRDGLEGVREGLGGRDWEGGNGWAGRSKGGTGR